jgi:hypothetical protein
MLPSFNHNHEGSTMSSISISPDTRAICLALDHLAGIHEQAADLQALLAGLERLPDGVAAEALRTLHRLDTELAGLVQRIGEAGPG